MANKNSSTKKRDALHKSQTYWYKHPQSSTNINGVQNSLESINNNINNLGIQIEKRSPNFLPGPGECHTATTVITQNHILQN